MNELRRDHLSDSWVIVATERLKRPQFVKVRIERDELLNGSCPFCYGHEAMTPPEIFAVRKDGSAPNGPGWSTRVTPNKFPALKVELNPEREASGFFESLGGCGAHEVIIETPQHDKKFSQFTPQEFFEIFFTFQQRILDLKQDIRLAQIMIFKNSGVMAGATLAHPHSQLIALPMISARMLQKLRLLDEHRRAGGDCLLCELILREAAQQIRIVFLDDDFIVIAPYASRFSFELLIMPRRHQGEFEHTGPADLMKLATLFSGIAARIAAKTEIDDFNLVLNTTPRGIAASNFHWHIEFFPQINRLAAFEWSSGFFINPILPEDVAKLLGN